MSRRIRVQSYRPSDSAAALATYLGVTRLSSIGSRFRGRASDIIINWGNVRQVHPSIYLNPLDAVKNAANKLTTFKLLESAGVSIPPYFTSLEGLDQDTIYVARTTLTGHSGEGIVVGTPSELPSAQLYTTFLRKKYEYRAIVVGNQVVDIKQKLRRQDFEGERSPHVWNHSNGFVYARNDITIPDTLPQLAIAATAALGLTYGAVDIINHRGILYVLEVNTAFGLEGTTTQLVGDAIRTLLQEQYDATLPTQPIS